MKLTKQQEMVLRYNWWTMKLNQLSNSEELFDFLPRNYEGKVSDDDVNYLKFHYEEMRNILAQNA